MASVKYAEIFELKSHKNLWPATPMLLAVAFTCCHAQAEVKNVTIDVINGHQVESLVINNPEAKFVVVFENGSRATLDKWDKVIAPLALTASIFAYNRPGYGHSQTTESPRDGNTIVDELRQSLKHKGLAPPYILVGHSLGGLYTQLFAKRFPQEVCGMVLVDSLYPRMVKKPEDFPLQTRLGKWLFFSKSVEKEIDSINETGEQILSLSPIDDLPIIQIFNRPKGKMAIGVDFGAFNTDKETAIFVKRLYPNAQRVIVDSDHQMQSFTPDEIVRAINDVITGNMSCGATNK